MAIKIAEYLGHRTDSETQIFPIHLKESNIPEERQICPFHGERCIKISKGNAPVCSLRRTDEQFYIVCEHRLISSKSTALNEYRSDMLHRVAKEIFHPNIQKAQVHYKREQNVMVAQRGEIEEDIESSYHHADFILAVPDMSVPVLGPRRMVVEIQGGGETSETKHMNSWANEWANNSQNNEFLRQKITKPGTIQTNAWRRLQEQILGKGSTAAKTGYGFAAIIGEVVADYIERIMPGILDQKVDPHFNKEWNMVFVVFKEANSTFNEALVRDSVELRIDTSRTIYTTRERFIEAIRSRGVRHPEVFENGSFKTIEVATNLPSTPQKGRKSNKL